MNILIIEDEEKTSRYISKGLMENGYRTSIANTGPEGLYLAQQADFNLILLDVMLPEMDGWSILTKLRETDQQIPVLMLTARDEIEDRVKGLELGADDYLVKPFSFSELLARIHALTRRQPTTQNKIITIKNIKINVLSRQVYRNNQLIDLSAKEFTLLALLAQHPNTCLSRTVISEKVWGMHFDSDTNVVDVTIRRLRKKLKDDESKQIIQTVRGAGYKLDV